MRIVAVLTVVGLMIAACGTPESAGPEPPPVAEALRSDVAFEASAPDSDLAALAASDLAFTADLLEATADGSNVFLSPLSITTALGMLEAGARGETRAELAEVLHETLSEEALHAARGTAVSSLVEGGELPEDVDAEPFVLRSVNSLWLQRDYEVLQSYLDTLAGSYDAGLFLVDYVEDPDGARVAINDWVAEQTEDRIEDLIPAGVIDAFTRLVLTNAVYFKANWMHEFQPDLTADAPFTLTDGSTVDAPMMIQSGEFQYLAGDGFQAVWLPYWGGASMMLLLPDGSPQELLESLDGDALVSALAERRSTPVAELALPKFELEVETGLTDILRELGMETAFEPPPGPGTADLTGIVSEPELSVSEVLHKAFVSVDETGTEAAAATAVVISVTAAPVDEPVTLRFDRPFVLLIHDDATGAPLFAGVIEDPLG